MITRGLLNDKKGKIDYTHDLKTIKISISSEIRRKQLYLDIDNTYLNIPQYLFEETIPKGTYIIQVLEDAYLMSSTEDNIKKIRYHHGDITKTLIQRENEFSIFTGTDLLAQDESDFYPEVICFLNELKKINPSTYLGTLFDLSKLYLKLNICDISQYDMVLEEDEIMLMKYKLRPLVISKINLFIINRKTLEFIGNISCELDKEFTYDGNVSYFIHEKYRQQGYATKALNLVIKLLKEYDNEINKRLYISTVANNIASQKVALKNGADLYFSGEVPKNDDLWVFNRVNEVKIYTINPERKEFGYE